MSEEVSEKYRCPECGLISNTRYRQSSKTYVCNRCGHEWKGSSGTGWVIPLLFIMFFPIAIVIWGTRKNANLTWGLIAASIVLFVSFCNMALLFDDANDPGWGGVLIAIIWFALVFIVLLGLIYNKVTTGSFGRSLRKESEE